ncbi:MAG: glycosyltransferase family 39 protein [Vicinamibacterales bacterium]
MATDARPADPSRRGDMTRRSFVWSMVAVAVLAAVLRGVFPTADPPWRATVGIVWHDEGAWTHNARNKALFGAWRLDEWNPLFIAPVFTGLEYASFAAFGVGVKQARLVSEVMGWLSVVWLGLGVARLGTRRAGVAAAALLATNYVYVMYDRAALMEASMIAFMVGAWYAFERARTSAAWGLAAGALAWLAYFTKASGIFFVAALGLVALVALCKAPDRPSWREGWQWPWRAVSGRHGAPPDTRAALTTILGLLAAAAVAVVFFVGPFWSEYRFYNWVMSVTRKPTYDWPSLVNRASWFPIIHDFFTRMWLVSLVSIAALVLGARRWWTMPRAELLLHAWILLGSAELVLHDTGNERRLVFLIPAMVALASLVLVRDRRLAAPSATAAGSDAGLSHPARTRWPLISLPFVAFAFYMAWGAVARLPFIYDTRPGVRLAAALAVASAIGTYAAWPLLRRWLEAQTWTPRQAVLVIALVLIGDLGQFGQWAEGRSYKNYEASVELGRRLPAGTLVHGKLANGLALENRIRPIFVGRGFGNYADRLTRDDIRYLVTYTVPRLGYEGPVIQDVVGAYPHRRLLWTFDVRETTSGLDQAALFEKVPSGDAGASVIQSVSAASVDLRAHH